MKNLLKRPLVAVGIAIVGIGLIITGGSKMNQIKSVASTVTKTETAKASTNNSDPPFPDSITPASSICNNVYADMGGTSEDVLKKTSGQYNTTWSVNKWLLVLGSGASGETMSLGNGVIGPSSWTVSGAINSSSNMSCYTENWQIERFQSTGNVGLTNGTYIIRRDTGIDTPTFQLINGRFDQADCPYLYGPFMANANNNYSPSNDAATDPTKVGHSQTNLYAPGQGFGASPYSNQNGLCEYSATSKDVGAILGVSGNKDNAANPTGRNTWGYYSASTLENHPGTVTYIPTEWRVTGQIGQ